MHFWPVLQPPIVPHTAPQSTSVSAPFCTPSEQEGGAQCIVSHMPLQHSEPALHGSLFGAPQPREYVALEQPVSRQKPFTQARLAAQLPGPTQASGVHLLEMQEPLWQSTACPQVRPSAHGGHDPPQSTSVSLPSWSASVQVGVAQTLPTHTRPMPQLLESVQGSPTPPSLPLLLDELLLLDDVAPPVPPVPPVPLPPVPLPPVPLPPVPGHVPPSKAQVTAMQLPSLQVPMGQLLGSDVQVAQIPAWQKPVTQSAWEAQSCGTGHSWHIQHSRAGSLHFLLMAQVPSAQLRLWQSSLDLHEPPMQAGQSPAESPQSTSCSPLFRTPSAQWAARAE
jgi:hypothetical protein